MNSFSFQGKVYLGARLAGGKPGALFWVGDAPKCDVSLQTEAEDQKESYSGNRLTSARLQKGNSASVALTLNWANLKNLAVGLYGTEIDVSSGSVTAEVLPTGLTNGAFIALNHGGVSSLVVKDSAGTPATLVAGTDYRLDSANGGVIEILNIGTYVQPFKADYAHTASADVTMFTTAPPERYLLLDGINTIDSTPVRVRLYKVRFDPSSSIPFINDGFGQLELNGSVLYDAEAAADANLGGFGKIEQPTAV
jgi:hypothetical protein